MNIPVISIILLCAATSAAILANMLIIMMIGEINRKREEGNLVSYFDFTPGKVFRVFKEYRSLYPDGKLHLCALSTFAVAMIGLIIAAICEYSTR